MSEDLDQLRYSIDCLDNEILQTLAKRMELSDRVIAAKNGTAAFRPGREASLVRQLVSKSKADSYDLSPCTILSVWRQIMAESLRRQNGELACAVHNEVKSVAMWHMGSELAVMFDDQLDPLIDAVATGQCRYALVPAQSDNSSDLLACLDHHHKLKIIARTPLYNMQNISSAFIIADYLPDSSGDDISLYAVRATNGFDLVRVAGHHELVRPSDVPAGARLVGGYAR